MRETVHVAMKGNPYVMGIVPQMLSPYDPRPVVEQLNEGYAHGGGWHDFKGFTVVETEGLYELAYPGDPNMPELARIELRDEKVVFFECAWVMCVGSDGSTRIARMD